MGYCSCKVPPELTNFTNPKEHGGDSWPWDTIKTLGCVSNNLRTNDFPVGRGTDGCLPFFFSRRDVVFLHMKTWGMLVWNECWGQLAGRELLTDDIHQSRDLSCYPLIEGTAGLSHALSRLWLVRWYLCLPLTLHCLPQHHWGFFEDLWQESGDRQANPPKWRLTSHTFFYSSSLKKDTGLYFKTKPTS